MQTYKGTHGTCASRALKIEEIGFTPSEGGWVGHGVYFWAYLLDDTDAVQYARKWHKFKYRSFVQAQEDDPSCAVLHVEFPCNDDSVLDLTTEELQEEVRRVARAYKEEQGIPQDTASELDLIESVYRRMLKGMEQIVGVPDLIKVPITPPFKLDKLQKTPTAYIVRDRYADIDVIGTTSYPPLENKK